MGSSPPDMHHNAVDLFMILKHLYGMYDNGLSMDQQKLLGPVLGMHSFAGSAGKDYGYVQCFFSLFVKLSVNKIILFYSPLLQKFYHIITILFTQAKDDSIIMGIFKF